MPEDDNGIPQVNAFKSHTFKDIEEMFRCKSISNYSYLYTATPLTDDVPSFTLVTDNKFDTELVILRWKYIHSQLEARGVKVISFAADGDSRLLSAMRTTYGFSTGKSALLK